MVPHDLPVALLVLLLMPHRLLSLFYFLFKCTSGTTVFNMDGMLKHFHEKTSELSKEKQPGILLYQIFCVTALALHAVKFTSLVANVDSMGKRVRASRPNRIQWAN